jgi:hypothetical protein
MPGRLTKATLFRAWARAMSVDAAGGLVEFEAALLRQREIGTYEGAPIYGGMRAEIFERAGKPDHALVTLDETIAASTRSGQVFWLPELLRQRGSLRHVLGRAEECAEDLRHAIEIATGQDACVLADRARADMERFGLAPPPQ